MLLPPRRDGRAEPRGLQAMPPAAHWRAVLAAAYLLAAVCSPAGALPEPQCGWRPPPHAAGDTRHEPYWYDFARLPGFRAICPNASAPPPAWGEHTRTLPCCPAGDDPGRGRYFLDAAGHYTYEPDACRLCRATGAQARECLAGRRVVMFGDSIMRYQYMSLAHLLSKLRYPERYGNAPGAPSLCLEKEWPSWGTFYEQGSQLLGAAAEGCAEEDCACQRADLRCRDDPLTGEYLASIQEDRDLHVSPLTTANLTLSYRHATNHPDFETATAGPLRALAAAARAGAGAPDAVVVNVGHWWYLRRNESPEELLRAVLGAGRELRDASNGTTRLVWQTTSAHRVTVYEHAHVERRLAAEYGWEVIDLYWVSRAAQLQGLNLYWDALHFLPLVYEAHNDLLLAQLCDGAWGGGGNEPATASAPASRRRTHDAAWPRS